MILSDFIKFIPVILSLTVSVLLIFLGRRSSKSWVKQLSYNIAAIFIACFIFLLFVLNKQHKNRKLVYLDGERIQSYSVPDSLLGYRPMPVDAKIKVDKWKKRKAVYSSNIRLKNGWRTVPSSSDTAHHLALFLGGSFCFGEGLDDAETLAEQFVIQAQGDYRAYNLGFHGYGPHHALRILETALMPFEISANDTVLAFYRMIPDHIRRAAGYSSWDRYGPSYKLVDDKLINAGQFHPFEDTQQRNLVDKVMTIVKDQLGVNQWLNKHKNTPASEEDVLRSVLILSELRDIIEKRTGCFIVLLEPEFRNDSNRQFLIEQMKARGIRYLELASLEQLERIPKDQRYIPGDGHPSALYNRYLGKALDSLANRYICTQE